MGSVSLVGQLYAGGGGFLCCEGSEGCEEAVVGVVRLGVGVGVSGCGCGGGSGIICILCIQYKGFKGYVGFVATVSFTVGNVLSEAFSEFAVLVFAAVEPSLVFVPCFGSLVIGMFP